MMSDREELLADLERAAEQSLSLPCCATQSDIRDDHNRCLEFIEQLTSPLRTVGREHSTSPSLPDYGPLEEIGRGGMGIVYRGQHRKTHRIDAIKIIRPDRLLSSQPQLERQFRFRFEREARLASRVSHEHIVTVYQVGEDDGCVWYSMQLVNGCSLHDWVHNQAFAMETGVSIIEKIARALSVVHRHGVLHGDIKPRNILIEHETNRPFLTDFGLAELAHGLHPQFTGVVGTFAYMAPELVEASRRTCPADEVEVVRSVAADIYSVGATLCTVLKASAHRHELVSKGADRETTGLGWLRSAGVPRPLPAELLRICKRCLAFEPSARYATAEQLADELARWLDRPSWNRHFPALGRLLWMIVAPGLALSGLSVWGLLQLPVLEVWIWLAIFGAYGPLFAAFGWAQSLDSNSHRARRELWSIWLGHFLGALVCMIALRILCPDLKSVVALFYPCCAAISAVAFLAKSGNFWDVYRPIGVLWAAAAIGLALLPTFSPALFGMGAALTCLGIAWGDRTLTQE